MYGERLEDFWMVYLYSTLKEGEKFVTAATIWTPNGARDKKQNHQHTETV